MVKNGEVTIIMPKKYDWYKLLDKSWYLTKILFTLAVICSLAYGYGTFNPNEYAEKKIFKIAENDYGSLGDTSTLAEPAVVDDLIINRMNDA